MKEHIRDEVSQNCLGEPKHCFREVVGRWLSHEDGTGDNPRTWETISSTLNGMGQSRLMEEVKQELFSNTCIEAKGR